MSIITGKPTVVGYTAEDLAIWSHVMARSIRAAGGRRGHILHNAYGDGLFTGEVLPDGSEGELVFTSLTKQAMPVIRYRTRDLSKLMPGTARTMRRMEKITGRSDDMIILRGVNLFPTQIEELILRTPELSPHFQCVLTREGRMDDLTVLVERREFAPMDQATAAGQVLRHHIKATIGVTVSVDVVDPDTVERSVGKMRRIVDKRPG